MLLGNDIDSAKKVSADTELELYRPVYNNVFSNKNNMRYL